ncbi:aldo/keto reductase [Zobellia galactanivorans]|uniref:Aldo/keto reductase related to aryl-alcohol dehydrogenases n=1 Tax=Zobellia galactanivorans (strain DSM 12802 / CCUG 47099 / CIP 106680 / NCIMB 13871 / Dsij) TaxID=63186 RepID=G0L3X9_ZOBGA|nr:aldo/keto reductase [Zobellia galactanivorans]MBU3027986.1 aldo/keto reductase [Zobellia galactanivorans]MDO6808265.1 aldo/keto reductase [Zobellia galactanivorans]CAZ95550.1 Aldo/keto reductase related to aryl-alcohol dehydrogenases [Zobellia galactanivorans]
MQKNKFYSKVIAGTMTWGSWGKGFSKSEMIEVMNHCVNVGITTFDHADIYGGYTTEEDFGKAFVEAGISRENIQLISKCGIQLDADARPNRVKHYQYDAEYIVWSAEQSLKKLRTDYLDLLLLHRPSPLMRPDAVAEAIVKLKDQGKVRAFGVSNFLSSQIALIETETPIAANQIEFSLTHNGPMYDGTLDDALVNKRMVMSYSPLGSFFREKDEVYKRVSRAMEPMLPKYGATEDQLLLAWVMRHPSKVYPVVGTTTKPRISAAIEATKIEMELTDWFVLLEAAQGHEVP